MEEQQRLDDISIIKLNGGLKTRARTYGDRVYIDIGYGDPMSKGSAFTPIVKIHACMVTDLDDKDFLANHLAQFYSDLMSMAHEQLLAIKEESNGEHE